MSIQIYGLPCSPGFTRGKPFVINDPDNLSIVGDILVINGSLKPEYVIQSINKVAGIISKYGGFTSHGANISRTAGIPLISDILDISLFDDAISCEMDGSTGLVIINY